MANRRVILYLPPVGIPSSYSKPIELDSVGTSPSNQILLLPETDPTGDPFTFTIAPTTNNYQVSGSKLQFTGTAGKILYVDWGDSTAPNTYTLTGISQNLEHEYATSGTYTVTVSGDTNFITAMRFTSMPATVTVTTATTALTTLETVSITEINGAITDLPSGLLTVNIGGTMSINFTSNNIELFPASLISLSIGTTSIQTFTGQLSNLASTSLTNISLTNLNGITGSLSGLAVQTSLTQFIYRYNYATTGVLTGSLSSIPDSVTYLIITGEPNITGNINTDLPTNAVTVRFDSCTSLTGSITGSFPTGLRSLLLYYLGTNITGTLTSNIQSSIENLDIYNLDGLGGGDFIYLNQVTDVDIRLVDAQYTYSTRTWDTLNSFEFVPPTSYGLSATDLKDLIVDVSYATWGGSISARKLTLTGANPAPNLSDPDIIAALARLDAEQVTYTFTV